MHAVTVMATTLGWLAAIALAAIGVAKTVSPRHRIPRLLDHPLRWVMLFPVALATLTLGHFVHLLPRADGIALSFAQQALWTAGCYLLVPVVRRVRSAAFSDSLLTPLISELLLQVTAMQRRAPDPASEALLDQARAAGRAGHGRQALRALRRAADHVRQNSSPVGEEWTALEQRLEHLCTMHGV